jgi:hypothetical protein
VSDTDARVAAFLIGLEELAVEFGDDVVLATCRRFLADPQAGFSAALRAALGEAGR